MARKAPPRRLELRSSAPEADTLSTELRGRATEFYHINIASYDGSCTAAFKAYHFPAILFFFFNTYQQCNCWKNIFLCLCYWCQGNQLRAQILDDPRISPFISQPCELFLFVGQLAADLVEARCLYEAAGGQSG